MNPLTELASLTVPATIVVTFCYIGMCVVWPFGPCRRCHGTGKHRAPAGRAFRDCRRCHGTGRRIRTGRRLYNHLRRLHRDFS